MTRRDLMRAAIGQTLFTVSHCRAIEESAGTSLRIRSARLGKPIKVANNRGDTWVPAWAADDTLYVSADDTYGFGKACNSNLAINRILGGSPPNIQGESVNCMPEYGHSSEMRRDDGGYWKACGLAIIDGVLYLAVNRQLHCSEYPGGVQSGRYCPFPIQEAWDASLIKSADGGKTWSKMPKLRRAMFPGRTFSTPFFVDYGKDGQIVNVNGADRYVYVISNDGAWNNGNWMTLGRVRRDRISRLDSNDWEFVQGFNDKREALWGTGVGSGLYVFRNPDRTSNCGLHYIAPLGLYILPQWYYTRLDYKRVHCFDATRWELYCSPAPWGPWTLFHTQDFDPEGWYNPTIPAKFISSDGLRMWIFMAGNFDRKELGCYALFVMEMQLEVEDVRKRSSGQVVGGAPRVVTSSSSS